MMKKFFFILGVMIFSIFIGCAKNDDGNNLIVIVKYKTLPNKSVDAVTGLKKLIEQVKGEDHFVSLKLHVDQKDNSNILLYEEWDDALYYQNQHMKTKHLKEFIIESQTFLDGPPEISYWKVNSVYK